jgi:hypothetical protein
MVTEANARGTATTFTGIAVNDQFDRGLRLSIAKANAQCCGELAKMTRDPEIEDQLR